MTLDDSALVQPPAHALVLNQSSSPLLFILDTNIISETLKPRPDSNVIAWLFQNEHRLYLTAVTIGEMFTGALRLPMGKRRENLLLAIERITDNFANRVFAFDCPAAQIYARMQDATHRSGLALTVEDGMIAAICSAARATLATHNTQDFAHLGIDLIDPFTAPAPDVVLLDKT